VDNRPQRRYWRDPQPSQMPYQPLTDYRFEAGEALEQAAGVYADTYGLPGPSDAYPYYDDSNFKVGWERIADHSRRVCFLKPDVFLIADTLTSVDGKPHEYELRWQLASTTVGKLADGVSVATGDADQPNLLVAPLRADGLAVSMGSGQRQPEILGWDLRGEPTAATTLRHGLSGETVRFVTLLLPLKPGQSAPDIGVDWASDTRATVTLSDGVRLQIGVPMDISQNLTIERVDD